MEYIVSTTHIHLYIHTTTTTNKNRKYITEVMFVHEFRSRKTNNK